MTNEADIRSLHEKVDRILGLLEEMNARRRAKAVIRGPKEKPLPLTEQEIAELQAQFGRLFTRWLDGLESEVQEELETFDAQALRRFADANNLNVTSKMPKHKVLQIIGARFREKRQLHRGSPPRNDDRVSSQS